ncbi:hypothetical protein [Aeromonas salmonicida]
MPERQDGEVGYQGLELGVIWLAVDCDPGARVDAQVSIPRIGGFFLG